MSHSPELYAKAFAYAVRDASKAHETALVKNFVKAVNRRGDMRLLKKIITLVEGYMAAEKGGRMVVVESARLLPLYAKKELLSRFAKNDIVREKIKTELVAGVRIIINGERELDCSFKGAVEKILA